MNCFVYLNGCHQIIRSPVCQLLIQRLNFWTSGSESSANIWLYLFWRCIRRRLHSSRSTLEATSYL